MTVILITVKIHEENERGICDFFISTFTGCIINNSIDDSLPMLLCMQEWQKDAKNTKCM